MHQQAILVTGNPILGPAGTSVDIGDIEKHYTTTAAANNGITYKCGHPKCGVAVIAVITKLSKRDRKNSPSSYFRAKKSAPHRAGCSHTGALPISTHPSTGNATSTASPNRTEAPAVWIDPEENVSSASGVGGNAGVTTASSSASRGTRSDKGNGVSKGRSKMVRIFAKEWLGMNAAKQKMSPFVAPWNPEGTYHTAFYALQYHRMSDVLTAGRRIYVGILKHVSHSAGRYIVTLSEVNVSGEQLTVVVSSSVLLQEAAGAALSSKLAGLIARANASNVFVLGEFSRIDSVTLALTITHPHHIYLP